MQVWVELNFLDLKVRTTPYGVLCAVCSLFYKLLGIPRDI